MYFKGKSNYYHRSAFRQSSNSFCVFVEKSQISIISVALPLRSCDRLKALSVVVLATDTSHLSSSSFMSVSFANLLVIRDIVCTDSISFAIIEAIISQLLATSGKSFCIIRQAVLKSMPVSSSISLKVISGFCIFADITLALSLSFVLDHFIFFNLAKY